MIPKDVAAYLKKRVTKGKLAAFTGAGVSAESGIPTFRGKGGLWEKYDPQVVANAKGLTSLLRKHPGELADFINDFYGVLLKARPNPAHVALSLLEKEHVLSTLITQNIDNLHQEAGSRSVIELHGNAFRIRCTGCSRTLIFEKERLAEMTALLKRKKDSYLDLLKILGRYFPRCGCGGRFRIDIVMFGELLPEEELSRAYECLEACETLLVVGSSLVVYPAAGLPLFAKEHGATIIEINHEPSALSNLSDFRLTGKASELVPAVAHALTS